MPKILFEYDDHMRGESELATIPIQCHRKLVNVFIMIARYQSMIDQYSWISMYDVLERYGCKMPKDKPRAYHEVLGVLRYMESEGYFEVVSPTPLSEEPNYKIGLKLKTNPSVFFPERYFFELLIEEIDTVSEIAAENDMNFDMLITTYCYVRYRCNTSREKEKQFYMLPKNLLPVIDYTGKASDKDYTVETVSKALELFTKETTNYLPLLKKTKNAKKVVSYKENKDYKKKDMKFPIPRKF